MAAKSDAAKSRADPPAPPLPRPPTFVGLLSTFIVLGLFFGAVRLRTEALKQGASIVPPGSPASLFSGRVAMRHVMTIAAKPRWVGSVELDNSLDYVRSEMEAMRPLAEKNGMLLEVEAFTANGSFPSSIGMTNVLVSYNEILSVVARLSPVSVGGAEVDAAGGMLLVNAHVDSAMGAAGGSDNVAGVGIALEALRSIARTAPSVDRLARPIVFLFNGAEEALTAGADGFMKSHRWATEIATHINLESVGSGEAYLLFQLGPSNPWLAHAYARAVKRPLGSVSGTDVFEGGLVPGETDFRVFKEAGIPGYDFALIRNGHIYHTRYDDVAHVSMDCILHGGKVVLIPLALELAGSADAIGKHLAERRALDADESVAGADVFNSERAAFFDFLGLFTVVYSGFVSKVVASVLIASATGLFLFYSPVKMSPAASEDGPLGSSVSARLRMVPVLGLSCFAGLASGTVAALVYVHLLGRPLSWYGSVRFSLAVFVPPCLVGATTILELTLPSRLPPAVAQDSMMHAVSAVHSGILALMAYKGLLTSYVPMSMLLGCIFAIVAPLSPNFAFARFLLAVTPCAAIAAPAAYDALCVLLAVLGRAGTAPSEIIASLLVCLSALVYALLPLLPLYAFYPASIRRVRKWAFWIAVMVATLVALLPELTLPHRNAVYSKDAPKRIIVSHFYAPEQEPSNVLGIVPLDSIPVDVNTTVRMLPFNDKDALGYTPKWGTLQSTLGENARPYEMFLAAWSVFKVEQPLDLAVPTATVMSEVDAGDGAKKVTVRISAPDSMQISLRLKSEATGGVVRSWSFDSEIIDMGDGEGVWVRHVGRGSGAEELEFSVVIGVDDAGKRPPFSLDVTSTRPGKSRSAVLSVLYFPQWAAPVYLQTTGAGFTL
jgi:Peptidase family M28